MQLRKEAWKKKQDFNGAGIRDRHTFPGFVSIQGQYIMFKNITKQENGF